MPASIPLKRRLAAVAACQKGVPVQRAARRFGMGRSTLERLLQAFRAGGEATLTPRVGRPPRLLDPSAHQLLVQLALDHPRWPSRLLVKALHERTGITLARPTATQYLRRAGVRRLRPPRTSRAPRARPHSPTRYRPVHRRQPTRTSYPSDLQDAEWALLAPLFDRNGKRGRPSIYGQRALFNGIFYVLRSGCAWRMLPHDLPPWSTVHAAFKRWSRKGLLEKACHRLRRKWRADQELPEEPTVAAADTQSTETTEKGGPADMTAARK